MEKIPRIFSGLAAQIIRYYGISWMRRVESLHRCRRWMMDLVSLTLRNTSCHVADSWVRVFWHANPRLNPLLSSLDGLLSLSSYLTFAAPSSSGGFLLSNGLESPMCNLSATFLRIIKPCGIGYSEHYFGPIRCTGPRNTLWPVK